MREYESAWTYQCDFHEEEAPLDQVRERRLERAVPARLEYVVWSAVEK